MYILVSYFTASIELDEMIGYFCPSRVLTRTKIRVGVLGMLDSLMCFFFANVCNLIWSNVQN